MASVSKVRISLRSDDLSNWENKNPVLNNGELAIVRDTNGNARFKIGDGTTAFKSLSYVNENELETDSAVVKSLAQGLKTKATPLGLAAGAFLSANADFSQALGYNAVTKADDTYAFVWNGDAERALFDYYQSHGPGTFNINPADGLSGAYVGEQSLAEILGTKQDTLSADSDGNIYVAVAKADGQIDRSRVQLSALETVTANVRSTYYVEFDSRLGYGSLFPVKYKDTDPYDGYWEFYQTYERRVGMFNGTVDLIEVKSDDPALNGRLCCYLKSSPTSPFPIEGDILSAENLTWSEFEAAKHYEFTMLGEKCVMELKTYYDANGYSRASVDKLFAEKAETSSAVEVAAKFATLSTYTETKNQLSNDGYLTAHQSLDSYYQKTETSSDVELAAKFETLSTYSEVKDQLSNDGYLTAHQSLDSYYTKAQTSSDAEIAAQFSTLSTYSETKNALSNDGYLTAHQSLDSYYTKSETSSAAEISTDVDVLSAEISGKVCVGSILANEESEEGPPIIDVDAAQSLSVVHIDPAVYATMLSCEEVHPETVYFLDQENICAYDQKITDLADGTDAHDAVTVGQMNTAIGNINKILEELN